MAFHCDVLSVPLPSATCFLLKWRLKCRKFMKFITAAIGFCTSVIQ